MRSRHRCLSRAHEREKPRQLLGALARRRRVISKPTLTTAPHAALSGVSVGSRHMQEDREALFRGLTRGLHLIPLIPTKILSPPLPPIACRWNS